MTDTLDCIVVGAGVIGLAIARRLAIGGREVVVLEAEDRIGSQTSSRNSEVIHAGIYYPQGSLKARLCVAGKRMLYEYCDKKQIPHSRIGKLIVATRQKEEAALGSIDAKARANGVDDLEWLTDGEVNAMEPRVHATAALLSPSTGIIDSHAYMLSLQGDLEAAGGSVVLRTRVEAISTEARGFVVRCDDEAQTAVACRHLINAAGIAAPSLARRIDGFDPSQVPESFLAKGHYFSYAGRSPFSRLIYPVPVGGGLGIHVTNDLAGAARFGPDVEWIDEVDYAFHDGKKAPFVAAIRRYFPELDPGKLAPSYTGIRPKLSGPAEAAADFRIDGPGAHGVPGLVNLYGIESPGLTASLEIAEYVHALLLG